MSGKPLRGTMDAQIWLQPRAQKPIAVDVRGYTTRRRPPVEMLFVILWSRWRAL